MSETPVPEKLLTALQASERGPHEPATRSDLSETDVALLLLSSEGNDWVKYAWLLQNYWGEWPHEGDPRPELFDPAGTTEAGLVRLLLDAPRGSEDWRKYAWLLQWYWPQKYGGYRKVRPKEIHIVGRPPPEKTS